MQSCLAREPLFGDLFRTVTAPGVATKIGDLGVERSSDGGRMRESQERFRNHPTGSAP